MVFIAIAKLGLMQFYVFTGTFLTVDPQCRKLINVRVGCVCVCVYMSAHGIFVLIITKGTVVKTQTR